MTMLIIALVLGVAGYLLIGWVSGQVYMKVITDGYWEDVGAFGDVRRYKMGVGTGITWLVLWPAMWAAVGIITLMVLVGRLFSLDFWEKVFRL